jgi:hypothetical protein
MGFRKRDSVRDLIASPSKGTCLGTHSIPPLC